MFEYDRGTPAASHARTGMTPLWEVITVPASAPSFPMAAITTESRQISSSREVIILRNRPSVSQLRLRFMRSTPASWHSRNACMTDSMRSWFVVAAPNAAISRTTNVQSRQIPGARLPSLAASIPVTDVPCDNLPSVEGKSELLSRFPLPQTFCPLRSG